MTWFYDVFTPSSRETSLYLLLCYIPIIDSNTKRANSTIIFLLLIVFPSFTSSKIGYLTFYLDPGIIEY